MKKKKKKVGIDMWHVLGERRSAYRVLVKETLEKELPGRPKCR
jgi:hypothetical protein